MVYNNGSGFTTASPNLVFPGAGLQEQSSTLLLSGTIPNDLTVLNSASVSGNVLYSGSINIIPGSGIAFDGKTITSTISGISTLIAGPGIAYSSGTITNIGTLAPGANVIINSGSLGVPIYSGAGIAFSVGTIANTAPLYNVGSGLSLSSGTAINTGVLAVQGQTGNVSLVAGSGISIGSNTIVNTGQTTPLSAGPGISLANSTIINTGTLAPGAQIGISGGVVSNLSPLSGLVAGTGLSISGTTLSVQTGNVDQVAFANGSFTNAQIVVKSGPMGIINFQGFAAVGGSTKYPTTSAGTLMSMSLLVYAPASTLLGYFNTNSTTGPDFNLTWGYVFGLSPFQTATLSLDDAGALQGFGI